MSTSLYPQSPANIDGSLTALTSSYMLRVTLAIISIILFFVLYIAMVIGLAYLVKGAFMYEMTSVNKFSILVKIGAITGSIMLFVFTLKFIFKLKSHKPNNRIKLKKEENPELWKFVDNICQETGAPKPSSIYVDPDVNAYVSYTNNWLSLFLPVRKDLTIGLGLVSCLNLSEFKAVVTHEFGHFAQSSMKVGSYVMSANTIIHDMIFSRDSWDQALENWKSIDLRLSAAAWVITPIIWVIRQLLNLFYQFLNIMYSSLSREMEFNADKVAISTSGSDAIISALWKLDEGVTRWHATLNHAGVAVMKKIKTDNLYYHNQMALDENSDKLNNLIADLPNDERGGKKYFSSSNVSKVSMYASHPPNDLRQDNAKLPYISCPVDGRTPWLLFGNKEKTQSDVTAMIYKIYFNNTEIEKTDRAALSSFIESETMGAEVLEKYHNTFNDRFIHIDSALLEKSSFDEYNISEDEIEKELEELMRPQKEIEQLLSEVQSMAEGTSKLTAIKFKDSEYTKKNLEDGYNVLLTERQNILDNNFKEWDEKLIGKLLYRSQLNNQQTDLIRFIKQHQRMELFYRSVIATKQLILQNLSELQEKDEVLEVDINSYRNKLIQGMKRLNDLLEALDDLDFVAMTNIDSLEELKLSIIDGGKFVLPYGSIFENGGFDKTIHQLDAAIQNCQRIDQKSMITILSFNS